MIGNGWIGDPTERQVDVNLMSLESVQRWGYPKALSLIPFP